MTNFEKLNNTLAKAGASVSGMKKNYGNIYKLENDGKQIVVKMFKESEKANTLYTKVYIDGQVVFNASITPADKENCVESASKDLLNFINTLFKVDVKDVDNQEEVKQTASDKVNAKEVDKNTVILKAITDGMSIIQQEIGAIGNTFKKLEEDYKVILKLISKLK